MKKYIIPLLMLCVCDEAVSLAALCIVMTFVIGGFIKEAEKKGEFNER